MPKEIVLQGGNEDDPSFNEIGWKQLKSWNLTSSDYENHIEMGVSNTSFTNSIKHASYSNSFYSNTFQTLQVELVSQVLEI